MKFDVISFLDEYNIPYKSEGKNWQPGWTQICCPFCHDSGWHGGFNISAGYYNCWRCGHHDTPFVIMKLVPNIQIYEARTIMALFMIFDDGSKVERKKAAAKECEWPMGTTDCNGSHGKYLWDRGFDLPKIVGTWGIRATGPLGDYKFRIIAPIIVDGVMVSYQGRDITGKQKLRYKACRIEEEVIHHKHIVYGIDYVKNGRCIIVEGITDVWRLGPGAIAMFGIEWTNEQLLFLVERVKEGLVLFDSGSVDKARMLVSELNSLGLDFRVAELDEGDPGDMSQEDADQLMKLINIYN